jgi:hypothetical protein
MADEAKQDSEVENKESEGLVVEKPLMFFGLEEVVPIHADLAAVRHTLNSFTLMFFSTIVPVTEDRTILENLENIPAKCIARVVLEPPMVARLLDALGRNMAKHEALVQRASEGQGEDSI